MHKYTSLEREIKEGENFFDSRRKMASGWIKSFQCKSKALDDVVTYNSDHRRRRPLSNSSSCRSGYQSLKDIVETNKKPKPKKPPPPNHHQSPPPFKRPVSRKPEPGFPNPVQTGEPFLKDHHQSPPFKRPVSRKPEPGFPNPVQTGEPLFPSLKELPKDHPSRNVVEIIFHTSWAGEKSFSGEIEMVFKVQNVNRTLNRFEEYRDAVKRRAAGDARCTADGNEVMRFYCLGAYESGGGAWAFHGCKRAAVCTYSGSGVAHEMAGGGRGRRAMLVCRVVAGRVCKELGFDSVSQERVGYDSVSGENGELRVFDTRALLPCFLIIYKL